jgi:hypothetical protein
MQAGKVRQPHRSFAKNVSEMAHLYFHSMSLVSTVVSEWYTVRA